MKTQFSLTRLQLALALLLCTWPWYAIDAQEAVTSGQESPDIAATISGHLLRTRNGSELIAIDFPTLKETIVRRTRKDTDELYPTIHAIAGPDGKGRIVYIEDHFFVANEKERKHLLKTINIDGKQDSEVFSRPGSAMWATTAAGRGEIGAYLALSPVGGKAALLSGLAPVKMPKALLYEGKIEVWSIQSKEKSDVTVTALNRPMAWFPDGRRIAFVKLVPRDSLPKDALGLTSFGQYFGESWDNVPAVFVLDTTTAKTEFAHVGWSVIVSGNGTNVWIGGWDQRNRFTWMQLDPKSGISAALPGESNGIVAGIDDQTLLESSTAPGAADKLTLRIVATKTGRFQTVVPEFDARDLASFGWRER